MRNKEIFVLVVIGVATTIIGGLILSYSKPIALEVVSMLYELLHTPVNFFWVTLSIAVCMLIFGVISWKFWLPLSNQYDDLVDLTKLSPEDEIITIEPTAYLEVVKREVSDIPYLHFKLNAHNHSYYLFAPKRVELKCYNSGEKLLEDVWDVKEDKGYISARKHITVDGPLPKYQAKAIIFKVPIEKRYADWYNWDLEGCATYTNGEEERNVTIETHHQLSDINRHKLEELLEEALGDDI